MISPICGLPVINHHILCELQKLPSVQNRIATHSLLFFPVLKDGVCRALDQPGYVA